MPHDSKQAGALVNVINVLTVATTARCLRSAGQQLLPQRASCWARSGVTLSAVPLAAAQRGSPGGAPELKSGRPPTADT